MPGIREVPGDLRAFPGLVRVKKGDPMIRYPVVNLGQIPIDMPPAFYEQGINRWEETLRQEASRTEEANRKIQEAQRNQDYDEIDRWSRVSSGASKRWEEARDRLELLRAAYKTGQRPPVAPVQYTPSTAERPVQYPPIATPGSRRPIGMKFPRVSFPFGNLAFNPMTISPASLVSQAGPAAFSIQGARS